MKVRSINSRHEVAHSESAFSKRRASALAKFAQPGGLEQSSSEINPAAAAALTGTPAPAVSEAPAEPVVEASSVEETPSLEAAVEGQENTSNTASVAEDQNRAPVEESKTTTETATDPLSSQYAVLARKEKALRLKHQEQERAIKAREEALAAREAELTGRTTSQPAKASGPSADLLKTNPFQFFAEAGVSFEDVAQQMLNQGTIDPRIQTEMQTLKEELKALREERENERKAQESQQTDAYNKAVAKIAADAKKLVFTGDEFEMIKATNSVKDVVDLIKEHHKETGEVLDIRDAAQQVEDYLTEEAVKLARAEKIRKKLEPVAPVKAQVPNTQTPPSQAPNQAKSQPTKTLTNAASAPRKLSARERAMLAYKGEKVS